MIEDVFESVPVTPGSSDTVDGYTEQTAVLVEVVQAEEEGEEEEEIAQREVVLCLVLGIS